jgi:hypothetical protein
MASLLIGNTLLGRTFVLDTDKNYIRIDGIVMGNTAKFGYKTVQNSDINKILTDNLHDQSVVCLLYNAKSGNCYIKSGFNLGVNTDYSDDPNYSTYIVKNRIGRFLKTPAPSVIVKPPVVVPPVPKPVPAPVVVAPVPKPVPVVVPPPVQQVSLLGQTLLGQPFIQDNNANYLKIDGVAMGNTFGYKTIQGMDIGNILTTNLSDQSVVCLVYNWTTGDCYIKSGFNVNDTGDYKLAQGYTTFIVKSKISQFYPKQTGVVSPVTPTVPSPVTPTVPSKVFCPFFDSGAWPPFDIVNYANTTGIKYMSLAFIVGDQNGNPTLNGNMPINTSATPWYLDRLTQLRSIGGDCIISFGGAAGQELAIVNNTVDSLVNAYQTVIDIYKAKILSFDVEGGSIADTASNDRRNKALVIIRQRNPNIQIHYILAVMPDGFDYNGLALIQNAKNNGLNVECWQLMTMDYGQHNTNMGQACITAAQGSYNQLQSIGYTNSTIGLIPMIGQNDTQGEVFTLSDANAVLTFAKQTSYISMLSFWSLARDTANNVISPYASPSNSGISQTQYEFSSIFKSFTTL